MTFTMLSLSLFKNTGWLKDWILRRIFGPKGDKVTGDWRRLHKE
jgi:hypothetical protein